MAVYFVKMACSGPFPGSVYHRRSKFRWGIFAWFTSLLWRLRYPTYWVKIERWESDV